MQDIATTQTGPDLSGLDFGALKALRVRIDERVREMREIERPALCEGFAGEAAAIGMSLEEVVQLGAKRCGRPAKDRDGEGGSRHDQDAARLLVAGGGLEGLQRIEGRQPAQSIPPS